MLGNEIAGDLASALNRFDAEGLTEALNRHTETMQNLTSAINRLVSSLPSKPADEPEQVPVPELKKKPNPFAAQR